MINWKIPFGFAVFGTIVSLLAGIVGGIPFGVILLRSVVSLVVCGGLGLGVNLIVNKYLPEISSSSPIPADASGEEVDIVIDEAISLAEVAGAEAGEEAESLQPMVSESVEEAQPLQGLEEDGEELQEEVLPFEEADAAEGSAFQQESAGLGTPAVPGADFEDLDTLPDIDQFSPTAQESAPATTGSKMNSQVEEVVKDQDPETLARAVRTVMKKDQ